MSFVKFFKIPSFWIVLLLLVIGNVTFIRSYYNEPSLDEVVYTFVWEKDDPTWLWGEGHRFERQVSSFSDVLQTQYRHYFEVNGRALIHTVEQSFTGHMLLFCMINTCMFGLFIWLIVWYVSGDRWSNRYGLWVVTVIALLFCFDRTYNLWTSINIGLNYLWPAVMMVGAFILWEHLDKNTISKKYIPLIVLFAIIFGWSHEGYVVGFSGGMFLYYCIHYKKFNGQILWFAIPLWTFTAILIASPGNIARTANFSNTSGNIQGKLHGALDYLTYLDFADYLLGSWIFCALVVGILFLVFRGNFNKIKSFVIVNQSLFLVFSVALLFLYFFHTTRADTGVQLLSLLIILKFINKDYFCINTRTKVIIYGCLTFLLLCQQLLVARDAISIYEIDHAYMEEYKKSSDGLVELQYPKVSTVSKVHLKGADPTYWNGWNYLIKLYYGNSTKPGLLLLPEDYEAISSPETFFIEANRCTIGLPFYHKKGGVNYWINPKEFDEKAKYLIEYFPRSGKMEAPFYVKLKYAFFPEDFCRTEQFSIDTLNTRYGRSYRLDDDYNRYSKDIKGFVIIE